jgi:hypothetical protein
MARHETREIACYLRDGSLWVGHVVIDAVELDFGDDRVDGAHGLAHFVSAELSSATIEAQAQVQTGNRSAGQTGVDKAPAVPKLVPVVARLKRAA